MQKYCDTALFVPFDDSISKSFNDESEWGIRTFRSGFKDRFIHHVPFLGFLVKFIHFINGFRKVCKSFRPDIIHAHAVTSAGLLSVFLSKFIHIPVIVTEHQTTEVMRLSRLRSRIKHHFTYKNASKAVCVSKDQRERFRKIFPDVDFHVIYNGISNRLKKNKNAGMQYRREGYINCVIVAGFYARNTKGFQYLLPAIKILTEEFRIPLVLHICGDGKHFEYYRNMASELGIADKCIFYGRCARDDVYSIVSEMDFGISASLFESAGVNVEEMMLMGKPLVVTRSGGASSLVADYAAIIVDKGSTEALVNGIKEMSERYMTFDSKAIHDYAAENFDINKTTLQYLKLYQECLEN